MGSIARREIKKNAVHNPNFATAQPSNTFIALGGKTVRSSILSPLSRTIAQKLRNNMYMRASAGRPWRN